MREAHQHFRTKIVGFGDGNRFPVVLDAFGFPVPEAISYVIHRHRQSLNTLDSVSRTVAMLHNFLRSHDIDLRTRLQGGRVLDLAEATALSFYLRSFGPRSERIMTRRKLVDLDYMGSNLVGEVEWFRRRVRVVDYLRWLTDDLKEGLELSVAESNRIEAEVQKAEKLIRPDRPAARFRPQPALSAEQYLTLIDAIRPGSNLNPFPEVHQFRNFALISIYAETGLRRSEPLGLKCTNLSEDGKPPTVKLERDPNDTRDGRARRPGLKTMPRTLPITPMLHNILSEYKEHNRRSVEKSLKERGDKEGVRRLKSNPFLFVSAQGRPLSLSAVYNIFEALRMNVPGLPVYLSPHALRRTWNDLFSELQSEKLGAKESEIRQFLMGWVRGSSQSELYRMRWTQREAARAIIDMQRNLMDRRKAL